MSIETPSNDLFDDEISSHVVPLTIKDPVPPPQPPTEKEQAQTEQSAPSSIQVKGVVSGGVTEIDDSDSFFSSSGVVNGLANKDNSYEAYSKEAQKLDQKIQQATSRYELPNEASTSVRSNTQKRVRFADDPIVRARQQYGQTPSDVIRGGESTAAQNDWFKSISNQKYVRNPSDPYVKTVRQTPLRTEPRFFRDRDSMESVKYVSPSNSSVTSSRLQKKFNYNEEMYGSLNAVEDITDDEEDDFDTRKKRPTRHGSRTLTPPHPRRSTPAAPPPSRARPSYTSPAFDDDDEEDEDDFTVPKKKAHRSSVRPVQDSDDEYDSDLDSDSEYEAEVQRALKHKRRKKRWGHLDKCSEDSQKSTLLKEIAKLQRDGINVEGMCNMSSTTEDLKDAIEEAEEQAAEDDNVEFGGYILVGIFYFIECANYRTGEYLRLRNIARSVMSNKDKFNIYLRRIIRMYISQYGVDNPIMALAGAIGKYCILYHCSSYAADHFQSTLGGNTQMGDMFRNMMSGFSQAEETGQYPAAGGGGMEGGQFPTNGEQDAGPNGVSDAPGGFNMGNFQGMLNNLFQGMQQTPG